MNDGQDLAAADVAAAPPAGRISQLPTGFKMLVILLVALLPLGLIAVFASRESAHGNRLRHEAEAEAAATRISVVMTDAFRPIAIELRHVIAELETNAAGPTSNPQRCERLLARLESVQGLVAGSAILDTQGRVVCATSGFSRFRDRIPGEGIGYQAHLSSRLRLVRISFAPDPRNLIGIAEIPVERLAHLMRSAAPPRSGLILRQGDRVVALDHARSDNPLDEIIAVEAPAVHGQLSLEMRMPAAQISPVEILMILLPILTWAAGAIVGWLVVDRLLLRPLAQMQRAISAFGVGTGPLILPRLRTPAVEIRKLGQAFARATEELARHERELAAALDAQKRLTREIHHRVKNNLQVISSLISLHARGLTSQPVIEAYASIQRRVDALALVHRNHFADLDQTIGIPLRGLISEIASNLRMSVGQDGLRASMVLRIVPASVDQDVAVPLAFLITEISDLAMLCEPDAEIDIQVEVVPDNPDRAILTVQSPVLSKAECLEGARAEQFQRIAGGLARQLRSTLQHDAEAGRYSVCFPIRRMD